jgi:membrane associated rhomboid family serine protease
MANSSDHIDVPEAEWLNVTNGTDGQGHHGPLTQRLVSLWALVLESRYHPCRIEPDGTGWQLLVPPEHLEAAREELQLFEEENRNWPPLPPQHLPVTDNSLATLSVLILLATFHNLTQIDFSLPGHQPLHWAEIGNAQAARIMNGEWWRLVTALTLHADWLHLFSNLAIGGLFIVSLCREFGSGLAWSLLLSSGVLGNLMNANLQHPEHSSVGASTLVFGAVGILAAISLVRYQHYRQRRWGLPVAGAMALLALLGSEGVRTDLGAHLFGFVYGTGLGLIAEYLVERRGFPGRRLNRLLALLCAICVASAWWQALTLGP